MAEIKYFRRGGLSKEESLNRIVDAARNDGGLWLMIKERAMETRALTVEFERLGANPGEMERLFPRRLTPTISELVDELVSSIAAGCPPEMRVLVQDALLQAANAELDANRRRPS